MRWIPSSVITEHKLFNFLILWKSKLFFFKVYGIYGASFLCTLSFCLKNTPKIRQYFLNECCLLPVNVESRKNNNCLLKAYEKKPVCGLNIWTWNRIRIVLIDVHMTLTFFENANLSLLKGCRLQDVFIATRLCRTVFSQPICDLEHQSVLQVRLHHFEFHIVAYPNAIRVEAQGFSSHHYKVPWHLI